MSPFQQNQVGTNSKSIMLFKSLIALLFLTQSVSKVFVWTGNPETGKAMSSTSLRWRFFTWWYMHVLWDGSKFEPFSFSDRNIDHVIFPWNGSLFSSKTWDGSKFGKMSSNFEVHCRYSMLRILSSLSLIKGVTVRRYGRTKFIVVLLNLDWILRLDQLK